ncbi:MAG: DUF4065 domain-containing protein [Bdellovibrionales bacterium]|nr:DUF4065 domain-containing protein [Bdellovibrionales bacterium]
MKYGHNPLAIANHFIDLSNPEGLSLVQLIKLTYISHGFTLAILEKPLSNELAEAWKYGPVFPAIYHAFKSSKDIYKITHKAKAFGTIFESNFNDIEKGIMKTAFEAYKNHSASQIISFTHEKDGPWDKAWREGGKHSKNYKIQDDIIKKYYKIRMEKANS